MTIVDEGNLKKLLRKTDSQKLAILPEKTAKISRRHHWFSKASGEGGGAAQATYDETFLRFIIFLEK